MLGQIIMPVIIDGNSGPTDGLMLLAALILCNIGFFSIYIWRALWWLICFKQKNPKDSYNYKSFYTYVIYDDEMGLVDMNSLFFCVINGFALFVFGSWWIYHMLGGTMPFC